MSGRCIGCVGLHWPLALAYLCGRYPGACMRRNEGMGEKRTCLEVWDSDWKRKDLASSLSWRIFC